MQYQPSRYRFVYLFLLAVLIVGGAAFGAFAINRQDSIAQNSSDLLCFARLTAAYEAAVADALAAPPAPNPTRAHATERINAVAEVLRHFPDSCHTQTVRGY